MDNVHMILVKSVELMGGAQDILYDISAFSPEHRIANKQRELHP